MKKVIIVSVILILIAQSITFGLNSDEPSTWAVEIIESLNGLKILDEDVFVKYQENVTRGEFIYIAVRVYEIFINREIVIDESITFTDTNDVYALKGATVGITAGIGNGKFGYDDYLTREQLATLMIKVLMLLEMDMEEPSDEIFFDDESISDWAKESIYLARSNGIVSGVGDNRVAPQGKATKEAVLTIAYNMLKKYDGTTLILNDGEEIVIDISVNVETSIETEKTVLIMYSSETWGFCTLAKEFLQEQEIEYIVKDIYKDQEAYLEFLEYGFTGVPAFVGDGEIFTGFNEQKLLEYKD